MVENINENNQNSRTPKALSCILIMNRRSRYSIRYLVNVNRIFVSESTLLLKSRFTLKLNNLEMLSVSKKVSLTRNMDTETSNHRMLCKK